MFKKIVFASLIVLALAVPLTSIAIADQHEPSRGNGGFGKPGKRYLGAVTNVNSVADEFSIENRDGDSFTFAVNPDTKFYSRDGELESFDDLTVDMVVGVKAVGNDDGTLVAKAVGYIDPAMLAAERAGGEITAVGGSSFSILNRNAEALTFQVDDGTRYKSQDGSLDSFGDLEVGMKVAVVYIENDDGTLLAKAVFSGKSGSCKPGGPDGQGRPDGSNGPDGQNRPSRPDGQAGQGRPGGSDGPEGHRRPCGPRGPGGPSGEGNSGEQS